MYNYKFDGLTYKPKLDYSRLSSQLERVLHILLDGKWHTLSEIEAIVRPYARNKLNTGISARIRDLRKAKFGAYIIIRRRQVNSNTSGIHEYRLRLNKDGTPKFSEKLREDWNENSLLRETKEQLIERINKLRRQVKKLKQQLA